MFELPNPEVEQEECPVVQLPGLSEVPRGGGHREPADAIHSGFWCSTAVGNGSVLERRLSTQFLRWIG